ncbi:NTP transferase domain-containing protein [Streptomyces radicis]|uniref:Nucleotidyltransferase family protein n=1 Tax=Streptomyces radicis TaxID=1750517 RepID=A0A3A9W173_9ACTN|nr:nucleotidyltransferase family protein [Streptomyces radicis]RKN06975.1 nucleotidyltransferase family protein [Streptomyces radicis]RKN15885.1 nucleotidyltransferase family protein [Streptomyces radicis]
MNGAPVVAGLLLAAGGGRRLGGRAKALLRNGGVLFVERAADALLAAGCAPVHVVLGAAEAEVRARARLDGCALVSHRDWESGMGSSLRAGLASLPPEVDAALVALVDQPGIGDEAMARVRGAFVSRETLAAAAYEGRRGHPVLLGAAHFAGVAREARGDQGARGYLRGREVALVECGDVATPADIDEPGDLADLP